MFYLYDLTTYTKNYGSMASTLDDADEDDAAAEDLLRTTAWSDGEEASWHGQPRRRKRRNERLLNIDEAVQSLGMGTFQYRVGLAAGLLLAADSMEVVLLAYLSNIFQNQNQLDPAAGVAAENSVDAMNMVVFPVGVVGALVWGMLGDMWGRRKVFLACSATIAVFGFATALCNSYTWLLLTRLLVGFGIGGLTVPFCTFSEFLPPSQRGTNLVAVQAFGIVGGLLVHLTLQQQNQEWRSMVVLLTIPSVLAFGLGMSVVPESPRWLLSQNRHDEALGVLRVAAKANGKDPDVLFPAGIMLYSHEPQGNESKFAMQTLFSAGWLKLTLTLVPTYFGMAFLNHGTISLAVSVFANDDRQQDYQAIFTAGSQFASLFLVVFLIDGFGRASTQCLAYAVGGILCLAISLLEDSDSTLSPNVVLVLTFLAHTCMFGGKCATWISTTEILTTELRTTGHGLANGFSRVGGFLSSYVIGRIYSLPSVGLVLFVLSLWVASTASKLPETNVKEMGVVYYPLNNSNNGRRRRQRRGDAVACSASSVSADRDVL